MKQKIKKPTPMGQAFVEMTIHGYFDFYEIIIF